MRVAVGASDDLGGVEAGCPAVEGGVCPLLLGTRRASVWTATGSARWPSRSRHCAITQSEPTLGCCASGGRYRPPALLGRWLSGVRTDRHRCLPRLHAPAVPGTRRAA